MTNNAVSPSSNSPRQALAWRAAIFGWLWGSLAIIGGILWGVVSDQGTLATYRPSFWLWSASMLVMFSFVARRIGEVASLGLLNFTITRLGWMLVITVLWSALTAGPVGAYAEIFKSLTSLAGQPPSQQVQVIGALMLGQGFIILAALSWIVLLFSMFVPTARVHTGFQSFMMSAMLLFCGLALMFGGHSMGQLASMAPRI